MGSLVVIDLAEVNPRPPRPAPENDVGAYESARAGCSLVRYAAGGIAAVVRPPATYLIRPSV
jgi:hypothetical protein